MEVTVRIDELVLDGVEPDDPRVAREVERAVARTRLPHGVTATVVADAVAAQVVSQAAEGRR